MEAVAAELELECDGVTLVEEESFCSGVSELPFCREDLEPSVLLEAPGRKFQRSYFNFGSHRNFAVHTGLRGARVHNGDPK